MNRYETLLFLHVLGAFGMVSATTAFWVVMLAARRSERPTALMPATATARIAVVAGSLLTIVFGVWLTLYLDGYELWDGWILAALVLWAVSGETGRRGGAAIEKARLAGDDALGATLRDRRTLFMLALSTIAVLTVLVLMIWKPGA